nr:hypothetical protein [Tanacetum cinerariifolium]
MLQKCQWHGLTKGAIIQIFYHGLDEPTQGILDVTSGGIFLHKYPNQAFQLIEDKVLFKHDWSTKPKTEHHQESISFTDTDNSRFIEKLKAMDSQIISLNEELQDIRNKYNELREGNASKNHLNDDTPIIKNDLKKDLEDFKRCIRGIRTIHDKLYDRDDGKTTGVLPKKKSKPINQEPQSKTDFEKLMTKFLDDQRVSNMFFKNNVNDMIVKMKQNERNFQTKIKNMEIKIDGWSKSQNISLEQTNRTEPPPPPQAHTEHVNAVFTGSEMSDDSSKILKDPPPPIIINNKIEKELLCGRNKRISISLNKTGGAWIGGWHFTLGDLYNWSIILNVVEYTCLAFRFASYPSEFNREIKNPGKFTRRHLKIKWNKAQVFTHIKKRIKSQAEKSASTPHFLSKHVKYAALCLCASHFSPKSEVIKDLSASVNVIPKSMFEHLKLAQLKKTGMLVEMADMTKRSPIGIVENVIVKIDKFLFPSDFTVMDMLNTRNETMILGRSFIATIHAEINVFNKEISFGIGDLVKDPRERSFDDYKWMFDLEVDQLADEYELDIGKKGHMLDDIWENCKKVQWDNTYWWHDQKSEEGESIIIDETDCDFEEDIRLIEKFLYDNSSPRPPEEFVSANSDAKIKSFSPSPILVKDSDLLMEEIDLFYTSDNPMPPGIVDKDYDSERDILILKDFPSNNSLSFAEKESFHFDIPPFS